MTATAVLPFRPHARGGADWHSSAARRSTPPLVLRTHTGEDLVLDRAGWNAPTTAEERDLLGTVVGPAIDLGCGPGRLVVTLAARGVAALGVDSSPAALALARQRGAAVLEADVFGPVPGEGRWATCLLFDGTIGIGGDPTRLLSRCRELTGPGGRVLAEVERPGTGWRRVVAWFDGDGGAHGGPSFDWAIVGADAVADVAGPAGFEVADLVRTPSGRWFADLRLRHDLGATLVA